MRAAWAFREQAYIFAQSPPLAQLLFAQSCVSPTLQEPNSALTYYLCKMVEKVEGLITHITRVSGRFATGELVSVLDAGDGNTCELLSVTGNHYKLGYRL